MSHIKEGHKKKKKPFNRLDRRFQLGPEDADDYVFPEEQEIIAKLRAAEPRLSALDDKMILTFMFARRHHFEDTFELFQKFFAMADKQQIDFKNLPARDDPDVQSVINGEWSGWSVHRTRDVDVHNRMIYYYFGSKDNARDRPPRITYKFLFWELFNFVKTERLSSIRNGQVAVIDTEGFSARWRVRLARATIRINFFLAERMSLRALSMSEEGKQLMKDIQGTFPKRNHEWVVVDAGLGFRMIWGIGKVLLSKKMQKRVKLITSEELKEIVPKAALHPKWGGNMDASPERNYT